MDASKENLMERLFRCLAEVRTVPPLTTDSLLMADANFESIDLVDLLFVLEEEFSLPFTLNELQQHGLTLGRRQGRDLSVQQLADFVAAKIDRWNKGPS